MAWKGRTKQQRDGGASGSLMVPKAKGGGKAEQKSLNHGVGHAADQGFEPRGGQHAEADANLRRESQTRGVGILGPGARSGSKNCTGHSDLTGPDWNRSHQCKSAKEVRFLQAGQNVQSRHQENHAEHHAAPRSRSTQPNRVSQSGSTDGPHRQLWTESCKRSWKVF